MLHIALYEPEIPPNTGNIARSCIATGTTLHLIGRLGFRLDDRSLRRAGCDYWQHVDLHLHETFADFEALLTGGGRFETCATARLFPFSARRGKLYTSVAFQPGDCLLFGSESHGLPAELLQRHAERTLRIPMPGGKVRSLNLSTTAGIALYEALRQLNGS